MSNNLVIFPVGGGASSGGVSSGVLTSGSVTSGFIGNNAVVSGSIASGSISTFHVASGFMFVSSGSVEGFFGARDIASGTVGVFDFGSGAVIAGTVGSGAIVSGNIGSGQIGGFKIAQQTIMSGNMVSGVIPYNAFVQSGNSFGAAGNIGTNDAQNLEIKANNTRAVIVDQATRQLMLGNPASGSPAYGIDLRRPNDGAGLMRAMALYNTDTQGGTEEIVIGALNSSGAIRTDFLLQVIGIDPSAISGTASWVISCPQGPGSTAIIAHAGQSGQFTINETQKAQVDIRFRADPASGLIVSEAGYDQLYSKTVSGVVQLFHRTDTDVETQVTGSGFITRAYLASGAVTSGILGVTGTPTGTLFLRDDFSWATAGGAGTADGNASVGAIRTVSGSYTAASGDYTILANMSGASGSITVPAAPFAFSGAINQGAIFNIKKIDLSTNTVTVVTASGESIDGAASVGLATQFQSLQIQSDGTSYWIL